MKYQFTSVNLMSLGVRDKSGYRVIDRTETEITRSGGAAAVVAEMNAYDVM